MDPYLEVNPFWGDLHSTLIAVLKAELKRRVPASYTVWADIYIWIHEPDAETRLGKPDNFVTARPTSGQGTNGVATLSSPATSILPAVRREGNKYLKIKDVETDRVVTVVELLSPANKASGDDHEAYLAKRNEYLATGTNLVEIDLHRTGQRMPLGEPAPANADYYVLICRGADFPRTAIWPISVRDALPEIPVPLKTEDGFVMLPLQSCFTTAYDQGPYDNAVDYTKPPRIPLNDAEAVWASKLLAGKWKES